MEHTAITINAWRIALWIITSTISAPVGSSTISLFKHSTIILGVRYSPHNTFWLTLMCSFYYFFFVFFFFLDIFLSWVSSMCTWQPSFCRKLNFWSLCFDRRTKVGFSAALLEWKKEKWRKVHSLSFQPIDNSPFFSRKAIQKNTT